MTELKFEDYKAFFPERNWTKQQINFHEAAFNLLTTNRDTTKVTAIPAPCGVGKTTFITTLVLACLCDKVITDNLDRLKGIRDGSDKNYGYLDRFIKRWTHNGVTNYEKIERFERLIYLMDSEKDLMT